MSDPATYGYFLWLFLFLFFLRVLGQVIVVLFHPRWLPRMSQWYSGLMPYELLLPTQLVMLVIMAWMSADFSRGEGFFVAPKPLTGLIVVWFSYLYFTSMVVRYIIRMTRWPDQRWLGGTIPIIFHCVLAAFLWVFGTYHRI